MKMIRPVNIGNIKQFTQLNEFLYEQVKYKNVS